MNIETTSASASTVLWNIVYSDRDDDYLLDQLQSLFEGGYHPSSNILEESEGVEFMYYGAFQKYIDCVVNADFPGMARSNVAPFIEMFVKWGGGINSEIMESLFKWEDGLTIDRVRDFEKTIPIRAQIVDCLGSLLDDDYILDIPDFITYGPETRSLEEIDRDDYNYSLYLYSKLKYSSRYLQELFPDF